MSASPAQRKSRADAKLDNRVVADLPFFAGPNRTKKHRAAIHLAEGLLSERQIARELNMSRSTLHEWKQEPDFMDVQAEYEHIIRSESLDLAIANKAERMRVLNMLHEKGVQIIQQRAEWYANELAEGDSAVNATRRVFGDVTPPWAATGMLVRNETVNATGMKTVNWTYDNALAKDLRDTDKQAAQEMGQWDEKSTVDMQQTVTAIRIIGED